MTNYDSKDSYGWISILAHWLSAIVIIAMWFIGKSIMGQGPDGIDERRTLHVTIGLAAWLPLAIRIIWRVFVPHPHVAGQSLFIHRVARTTHYIMLAVTTAMMLSGPLLAWAIPDHQSLASKVHTIHATTATILLILVIVHILGALKHLMFHEDETIVRMLWPRPAAKTDNTQSDTQA